MNTTATTAPLMWAAAPEKLRINLAEYRFLEQAVNDTAIGCKREAIQSIVTYAKLHSGMCLKDEAAALLYKLETQPQQPRLAYANR
ncbi:hypothetical protein DNI29_04280 [Hymenobacter sediminis]|uniref:hypothetical protein n=1 Tax=Hymenobacter sediminis TaxID=2218621 RepID=UPI000DA69636|nr:hypothetical protein [Hymenobacter sediminis]RPD50020.1 hypothetical protein DNI29_04280 [Hymenobacter sediminis]